ncbi:MAG: DUF72 domain-containing protein [Acidobacteriaceae bacterium]|nr:DUF72 domain-containing protein [Acidobacteriaceae bacterium]MBV9227421.1 DUF72 domain-containing protein [Acidobacteriaceae bacterium]MBV9675712.1 DUF72 domain-containing protein [Acidobacteriaceae bacterium]MBV9936907.1 DUF72 domain-containing protein [Acidobacteriaceae bacterium]
MPAVKLYCGTSGFAYNSWKPDFYPQSLTPTELLAYYATRLNAVEISYPARFTSASRLESWIAATPGGFLFLPKAHLKFESAEELARDLLQSLQPLQTKKRLGPVLLQLTSHAKADPSQLRRFLKLLPKGMQVAFEFHNATWLDESVYQVLRDANAALCLTESEDLETPWVLTSDFVYLRLRKPEYLQSKLISVQYRVEQYLANAYPTFAIFKGGKTAAGALNAEKLFVTQKVVGAAS